MIAGRGNTDDQAVPLPSIALVERAGALVGEELQVVSTQGSAFHRQGAWTVCSTITTGSGPVLSARRRRSGPENAEDAFRQRHPSVKPPAIWSRSALGARVAGSLSPPTSQARPHPCSATWLSPRRRDGSHSALPTRWSPRGV